jgi:hypothetical protein
MRWLLCLAVAAAACRPAAADAPTRRHTAVAIGRAKFLINGRPTYQGRTWNGHSIEGLLFNSRMVQATFDDRNPHTVGLCAYPDTRKWGPERNTNEFLAEMPGWRKHGLLAVTLNLQGGSPRGYSKEQPWHNSALNADGSLDPKYMARLAGVIDRADGLGMVVILGIYYFGQDERLKDEAAVIAGVDVAIDWVVAKRYSNVLIEINNECNVRYDHAIFRPGRVHELIRRAKERSGAKKSPLLVGTSYGGNTVPTPNVVKASDFVLLHGNGANDPARIGEMVRQTRKVEGYRPMPVLFNEATEPSPQLHGEGPKEAEAACLRDLQKRCRTCRRYRPVGAIRAPSLLRGGAAPAHAAVQWAGVSCAPSPFQGPGESGAQAPPPLPVVARGLFLGRLSPGGLPRRRAAGVAPRRRGVRRQRLRRLSHRLGEPLPGRGRGGRAAAGRDLRLVPRPRAIRPRPHRPRQPPGPGPPPRRPGSRVPPGLTEPPSTARWKRASLRALAPPNSAIRKWCRSSWARRSSAARATRPTSRSWVPAART